MFPPVMVNGRTSQTTSVAAQAYGNARVKWSHSLKSIAFFAPPFGAFQRFPLVAEHDGYIWQQGSQSMLQMTGYWWLILGLIPVRVYFLKMRAARRRRANQCVHCGYDMRATQDRCPECGTVPVKN
ncbi:MAG TPA: hypothetical protein VH370_04960 [Humisphaera sp.]|nr:hypothetical protein [Humisphaera sp.]